MSLSKMSKASNFHTIYFSIAIYCEKNKDLMNWKERRKSTHFTIIWFINLLQILLTFTLIIATNGTTLSIGEYSIGALDWRTIRFGAHNFSRITEAFPAAVIPIATVCKNGSISCDARPVLRFGHNFELVDMIINRKTLAELTPISISYESIGTEFLAFEGTDTAFTNLFTRSIPFIAVRTLYITSFARVVTYWTTLSLNSNLLVAMERTTHLDFTTDFSVIALTVHTIVFIPVVSIVIKDSFRWNATYFWIWFSIN